MPHWTYKAVASCFSIRLYRFYSSVNFICMFSTSILLSCLHFGQKSGKLCICVSLFTLVLVLLWHIGQCTQPRLSTISYLILFQSIRSIHQFTIIKIGFSNFNTSKIQNTNLKYPYISTRNATIPIAIHITSNIPYRM